MDNNSIVRDYRIEKICYIDDSRISNPEELGNSKYKLTIDPKIYSDGEHTLKIVLIDEGVNASETVIPFTIRRSENGT